MAAPPEPACSRCQVQRPKPLTTRQQGCRRRVLLCLRKALHCREFRTVASRKEAQEPRWWFGTSQTQSGCLSENGGCAGSPSQDACLFPPGHSEVTHDPRGPPVCGPLLDVIPGLCGFPRRRQGPCSGPGRSRSPAWLLQADWTRLRLYQKVSLAAYGESAPRWSLGSFAVSLHTVRLCVAPVRM